MAATPAAIAALRREIADVRRREAELRRQADGCGAEAARMEAALAEAEAQRALTVAFWAGGGSLLAGVTDDTLVCVASFLPSARDLLSLGLACTRLSARSIAAPPPRAGVTAAAAAPVAAPTTSTVAAAAQAPVAAGPPETSSIIEEAARRWIASCTDQERGWVPRRGRESWLGLMWEVESLRRGAAVLSRSHEHITVSEDGSRATTRAGYTGGYWRTAASKAVMRAGRHYAQFTVVSGRLMFFGVIRPGWDVGGGMDADNVDGHCFYYTCDGQRCPGEHDWEGMQDARKQGDRIGMLLDLDQGSMTVYKNDERLGVMATGLSGEYCWAVTMGSQEEDSVRIAAAAAPASPTPEHLARAVAYEAEHADDY
jgi:hypothetical protein